MSTRLNDLLQRPITDRQRTFALIALTLATTSTGLLLTAPHDPDPPTHHPTAARPTAGPSIATAAPTTGSHSTSTRQVSRAAHRFLTGYLRYLYGRTDARQITGATSVLHRRLEAQRLRVSPATRRRDPRIRRLVITALPNAGGWRATATIADGGVSTYPIGLAVTHAPSGRLVVSDVLEAQ